MVTMSSRGLFDAAWFIPLGVVACAPDGAVRDIPPVVWSGENLDYAPQAGAYEPCAGTLPYMDRYVGLVADAMRMSLDRPVVYVHGSEAGETFCPHDGTLGCAFDDSVYSLVVPQEHELVHAVRGHEGFSQLFFEEGTAEVFGDDAAFELRVTSRGDLREGIEAASGQHGLPEQWYPRAGHFVAYLHQRHGPEVTAAILQQTDPYSSAEQAIAVVEEATGVPWAELREEYEAVPECDQAHYRYPLYGCEEPTALRVRCDGDEAVWIEERIACDDSSTVGPRDGEMWKTIAVEVPEDGEYLFFAYEDVSAVGARITIEECAMGCGKIVHEQGMGLELPLAPVWLRAGQYAVRLTRPEGEDGGVGLTVEGRDCE